MLDLNGDGDVSYTEFIGQFADVNVHQVIQRIRRVLDDSNTDIDSVVDPVVVRGRADLNMSGFKKIVQSMVKGMPASEIQSVYMQLLKKHGGQLMVGDFKRYFKREEAPKEAPTKNQLAVAQARREQAVKRMEEE